VDGSLYGPVCRICDGAPGADIVGNVILFLPLGLGLTLVGARWPRAVVAIALTSAIMELLQFRFVPGRDASLVDLATNVLGGSLGILVGRHGRTLLAPDSRASTVLGVGSAVLLAVSTWTLSWALMPSLPDPPWYSIRRVGSLLRPNGRVVDVRIAGEPLTGDVVGNAGRLRTAILRGEPVVAGAIVAPGEGQSTNLLQVIDTTFDDVVVLSRAGEDATFSLRQHARDLRLRALTVRIPGFFRNVGSDTVRLAGRLRDGSLVLVGRHGANVREQTLPLTARLGWALMIPGPLGTESHLAGALTLVGMLAPFAYWSARAARLSGRGVSWMFVRSVVLLVCFAAPAAVFRIAPSAAWEWGVAIATLAAAEVGVALWRGSPNAAGAPAR
jgi:hypothetical protein